MKRAIPLAGMVLLTSAGAVSAARPEPIMSIEPHFIALDDISVPIVDGNLIQGRMRFRAVIAATDAAARTRLQSIKPRLRSESVMAGIEFSRLHASGLRPVDAIALARALTASLRQSHPDIGHVLLVRSSANMG
jgi:hypothetical protein